MSNLFEPYSPWLVATCDQHVWDAQSNWSIIVSSFAADVIVVRT